MPRTCCVVGCVSRSKKNSGISFHKFPEDGSELFKRWLAKISRLDYKPTKHHSVCSDHFTKEDYIRAIHPRDDIDVVKHQLMPNAVPTVFRTYPAHKQSAVKKRKPPKNRSTIETSNIEPRRDSEPSSKRCCPDVSTDHSYVIPASAVEDKLKETERKLLLKTKELKLLKQKMKRLIKSKSNDRSSSI